MTYLEIVNGVLRRMREEEVTTVAQTTYSRMVGDFVNDAKRLVEESWEWSGLRGTKGGAVTSGIEGYLSSVTLTDAKPYKITEVYVTKSTGSGVVTYERIYPKEVSRAEMDKKTRENVLGLLGSSVEYAKIGAPELYCLDGLDADLNQKVKLYPQPDAAYSVGAVGYWQTGDLTSDSDRLVVPMLPVLHLAVAMLARERGETGGTSTPEYFAIADKYLSDAIALDAARHPEETIWYTP